MPARASGILLHPTSLPGGHGVGDLGRAAVQWLDWLESAGQTLWQVLPLGPPGPGGSPYDSPSSFAGSKLLLSLEALAEEGLLEPGAIRPEEALGADPTDLAAVARWKEGRLRRAWQVFKSEGRRSGLERELAVWTADPEQFWLDDFTLYAALKEQFEGRPWYRWPEPLRDRSAAALAAERRRLDDALGCERFAQFLFWRQWRALGREAERRGIRLLGDLPIYVAADSADVWSHRDLFDLDDSGRPLHVSGVPPDAFSATGQRWGTPVYRWQRLRETGYAWWIERLRAALGRTHLLRLDHFRGFAAFWQVPAAAATAAEGSWQPGPGRELFDALRRALGAEGPLPLVAEDLGQITDDVRELRAALGLPGMRVLQFALGDEDSEHLPHRYPPDVVAYTGTHDNDTSRGWYAGLEPAARRRLIELVGGDGEEIHWRMIEAVMASAAERVVVPLQDVLGLGSEGRMNTPGVEAGNWCWRLRPDELAPDLAPRLLDLTRRSGRAPATPASPSRPRPER